MTRKYKILIALAILVVVGLPVGYYGARHILILRIASWRAQGIAAAKANDNAKAADFLARYLRRRPEDIEALSYYVHSRELAEEPNGQHLAETIVALKTLLGLDPDRLEDRRHLLDLYVRLENRPQALDTADAILKKHPKDVPTIRIKTELLVAIRQYRVAFEGAQLWTQLAPDDLQAHLERLRIRALLGQTAQTIIDDATQLQANHPNDAKFELIEGFAYMLATDRAANRDEAQSYEPQAAKWLKAAAAHPNLPDEIATVLVEDFDRLGLTSDSLAIMESAAKTGHNPEMKTSLAKRYWEIGKWTSVTDTLSDLDPTASSSDATLIAFKAIASERTGKKDDAARCRAALASRDQAIARVWTQLLNRAFMISASTNPSAVAASAAAPDPAADRKFITDCRSALLITPDNVYVRYYLGDAEARIGEMDLALQDWKVAALSDLNWPVPCVRLVDALIQRGRAQEALSIASAAARRGTNQAAIAVSLARAWSAGIEDGSISHADDLLKLVNQIQGELPDDEQTLLIRIKLLANRGMRIPADHATAVTLTKSAIDRNPPLTESGLLTLGSVSLKYNLDLSDQAYAKSLAIYGPTPNLAYNQAVSSISKTSPQAALKLFDDLAAKGGKAGELPWQLARANFLDIAALPDAPAAWKALSQANPNNLPIQTAVISARSVRGDWSVMEPAIDRLKALEPDPGLDWRIAKARLMIESPRNDTDYEQASVMLDTLTKQFPGMAEPEALLGRALAQMKRTDAAIEHYTKASRYDQTNVPIALQLAALLQSTGDYDRVTQELDRISPSIHTATQRRQAAVLFAQQGKGEQAAKLLEGDPNVDSASVQTVDDQLLLATLYTQQGKFDKVEAILNQLQAKPTLATIRFAAGYYTGHRQFDKAQQSLAQLDTIKIDPGVKELMLASYYIQTDDLAKAEQYYVSATKIAPTNATAWRLCAVLQFTVGHSSDALTTLAAALKNVPNDESFKALSAQSALLKQFADDGSARAIVVSAVRDPQTTGPAIELLQILATWRQTNDAERASALIQQLVAHNPTFLQARTQLVLCYASMNRNDDAITAAQQAMSAFPTDPEPARVAVEVAAGSAKWETMRQVAELWRKRVPNNTLSPDLALVQADIALRDYDSATQRLQPYLPTALASPEVYFRVLGYAAIASINGNNGPNTAVVDKLWQLASNSHDWRVRWIAVGVDIKDPAKSAAWLDRLAPIVPATSADELLMLAQAYERIVQDPKDPELVKKSADLFTKAVSLPDASNEVLLSTATHAEHINDSDTAEKLYRRALAKDPNLWMAQNNLAMILVHRGEKLDEARSLATAAISNRPHVATLRDSLALAQSKSGDVAGAIDSINIAIKLEPDNPTWRVRLAGYQLAQGHATEASKALADIDDRRLDLRKLPLDVKNQLDSLRKSLRARAGA